MTLTPPPAKTTPKRVSSACQRCRQQKLKCDVQRPCTLCARAGVSCSASIKPTVWRNLHPRSSPRQRRDRESYAPQPGARRSRRTTTVVNVVSPRPPPEYNTSNSYTPIEPHENGSQISQQISSPWVPSSAAIQFMEEAFHQHDTTPLDGPETSAFSATTWTQAETPDTTVPEVVSISNEEQNQHAPPLGKAESMGSRHRAMGGRAESELLALLPSLEAATLLVDNYFNRIHWFLLVFHQSEFRELFHIIYETTERHPQGSNIGLGPLAVFLAVCIISLQYIDAQQTADLGSYGSQVDLLQKRILVALRSRFLEIVSLGCIEAVQVCVLLGSFYLYHGEPGLAWPICGCGLRIAQALNLHRQWQRQDLSPPDLDDPVQRTKETRKRCWWAVYEIETFCSMLYGFPLSVTDEDCDISLPNPFPLRSRDTTWNPSTWQRTGQATLLSYKHATVQLSIIVKSALVDLYGLRGTAAIRMSNLHTSNHNRLYDMMETAISLEKRLEQWNLELPLQLRVTSNSSSAVNQPSPSANCNNGLPAKGSHNHLFQLQALALKIAYENARILIHRPFLSYKMIVSRNGQRRQSSATVAAAPDPCQSSIQICREASLEISRIGSLPIFRVVDRTYAVSFVALHLLTAAIALSILTTLSPLSQESHDCKMAIRRLMEMQAQLSTKSIIAKQGFDILKQLMSLVLSKEMDKMLEFPPFSQDQDKEVPTDRLVHGTCELAEQTQFRAEEVHDISPTSNINFHQDIFSIESVSEGNFESRPSPALEFYEDPTVTQAILDFEQVINYPPAEPNQGSQAPGEIDYVTSGCFGIQDQSWIWGFNHYMN